MILDPRDSQSALARRLMAGIRPTGQQTGATLTGFNKALAQGMSSPAPLTVATQPMPVPTTAGGAAGIPAVFNPGGTVQTGGQMPLPPGAGPIVRPQPQPLPVAPPISNSDAGAGMSEDAMAVADFLDGLEERIGGPGRQNVFGGVDPEGYTRGRARRRTPGGSME